MPLLNEAYRVYFGGEQVTRIYAEGIVVWESGQNDYVPDRTEDAFRWFHENPTRVPFFNPPIEALGTTCRFDRNYNALRIENLEGFRSKASGGTILTAYWPSDTETIPHPYPVDSTQLRIQSNCIIGPINGWIYAAPTVQCWWVDQSSPAVKANNWGAWKSEWEYWYPTELEPPDNPAPPTSGYYKFEVHFPPDVWVDSGHARLQNPTTTWYSLRPVEEEA